MSPKSVVACALTGICVAAAPALAGPEWIEQGDAGKSVGTAQHTVGNQLHSISGTLSGFGFGVSDFEDMFLITITDPDSFSMHIFNADFDAQLFLFNITLPGEGFGLLANNDTDSGNMPFIGNMATDATGAKINLPGVYAIGISGFGRNPISNGGLIFNFQNPTEVSGPDGPGGINPLSDWSGEGQSGSYTIILTGAAPSDLPAPGALALLAMAAGVACPRRRR